MNGLESASPQGVTRRLFLAVVLTVSVVFLLGPSRVAAQDGKPTLKETTKWIKETLVGVSASYQDADGNITAHVFYRDIHFDGCRMKLKDEWQRPKSRLFSLFDIDLSTLDSVRTLEAVSSGSSFVVLKTYKRFVWTYSLPGNVPSSQTIDQHELGFPERELAVRMGKAFERLKELCRIEPPKSPF